MLCNPQNIFHNLGPPIFPTLPTCSQSSPTWHLHFHTLYNSAVPLLSFSIHTILMFTSVLWVKHSLFPPRSELFSIHKLCTVRGSFSLTKVCYSAFTFNASIFFIIRVSVHWKSRLKLSSLITPLKPKMLHNKY